MKPRILGEHPLAKDDNGRLRSRIGTLFPYRNVLVTLPGIHAMQRLALLELLNAERLAAGQPVLTREEESQVWENGVDLIIDADGVLIRPDPDNMPLAFKADEVLQELVPKHQIRYLHVLNEKVRTAIKRRGECWRINPLPKSRTEMIEMIARAKIGIGGQEIYYYNRLTGARLLTCDEFSRLDEMDDEQLCRHLIEIRDFSGKTNRHGEREVRFFMAEGFSSDELAIDFRTMDRSSLRSTYEDLCRQFERAVNPEYRVDDSNSPAWRSHMCAALISQDDESISEETVLGLSSEFFMQIHWLPGGRVEEGELIFDPVFEARAEAESGSTLANLCDDKSRGIIYNFVREYGDLEYVNVGRVIGSLSRRPAMYGRRDVYIAVVKRVGMADEICNIIRMQKWGIREHLDSGKPLLDAIYQSEEYSEYIQDRRLGCRQLGMNLPPRVTVRRLVEKYSGTQQQFRGTMIWSPYFQRDYIHGIASDKMPGYRFRSEAFALRFARLLGRAAAVNMIVGRCDLAGNVLFDDGDEVVIEDADGLPCDIVVADHTGTFADYLSDLGEFAADYAAPLNRRIDMVPFPDRFAEAYLDAIEERFAAVQQEYARQRRGFDTLFKHQPCDEAGNLAYRWKRVLERLDTTDPSELKQRIREKIHIPECDDAPDADSVASA